MKEPVVMFALDGVKIEENGVFASTDRLTAFSIVQSLLFQLAVADRTQGPLPSMETVEDDYTDGGERLPPR